jgi:branched-chain amino acid transport system permease protein
MLLQLLVNGVVSGAIYSIIAVGFGLVYSTTGIFHVAHAGVYLIAGYAFVAASQIARTDLITAAVVALAAGTLAGVLMELLLYRPLRSRGAGLGQSFVASLGVFILMQNALAIPFGTDVKVVRRGPLPTFELLGATVTSLHLLVIVLAALSFIGLHAFLVGTKIGTGIRALADNAGLARLMGIDAAKLYVAIFGVGSLFASLAAILLSFDVGIRPELGLTTLLYSAIPVIIGGVGYLPGAIAGAFVLGLIQNLVVWQISPDWQNTATFVVLLAFLVFRPQGVFGGRLAARRA